MASHKILLTSSLQKRLAIFTFLFGILILSASFGARSKINYLKIAISDTSFVRLGKSIYYLKLPEEYKMTEARGKEGQSGYNIIRREKGSEKNGFIEIKKGNPIGNTDINWGQKTEEIKSVFFGQEIIWKVYKTETNYLIAETPKQDISARVSSPDRNDIINLISIISTLTKK